MASTKHLIPSFLYWLRSAFQRLQKQPAPLRTVILEDEPDVLDSSALYLLGVNQKPWAAVFQCPCGCRSDIRLNLLSEGRPRWQAHQHWDSTVSLLPSVAREVGCRSHFWIRKGLVIWARML